jgi:hypothetical protein
MPVGQPVGLLPASTAFNAVTAGAKPADRAGVSSFLDCLPFVLWTAEAVVTSAIETNRTAVTCFFYGTTAVASAGGHAIATGAVVPSGSYPAVAAAVRAAGLGP